MMHKPRQLLERPAHEYWQIRMEEDPLYSTVLGERRFDDRLPDLTPQGRLKLEKRYELILERVEGIAEDELPDADRLTRTALLMQCRAHLDYSRCRLEEWTIDPLQGPQVELLNMESYQPSATFGEGRAMIRRWRAIGRYIDDHVANLERGMTEGKTGVRVEVEKVLDELESLLAKPDSEWPLLRPLATPHKGWTKTEEKEFRDSLSVAVREVARPAFVRYSRFLKSQALPRARPQERPGIVHIPGGPEAYARLVHFHTSLGLTPDELHQIGLREVARINGEMEVLGEKVFGTKDRVQILLKLRSDPSLYFTSRDEVFEKAETALSKAKAAIARWFGLLPKVDCEVVRMEEHEEKHSTTAYYRQPAADGTRPGQYYINTSAPETRPRYEAEALAYHESIPGHHLQIAIAQELEGLPEFRRYSGVTAFVEGWGLYAERLSNEMGLYSSDLDRIGVLSYDSWRACRLVVDTGMHSKKWTRQQAIDFMLQNSALAKNNIVNEVDRYIVWPGQALAYKTGQLEMMRLRREAEKRMGSRFRIKEFHDVMLGNGAVPLGLLRQVVEQRLRR